MSKRSASSVNSSSFLNLKADLAKKKSDQKLGIPIEKDEKPKKLPAFLRPSPGVLSRSSKDLDGSRDSRKVGKKEGRSNGNGGSTSSWASTPSSQLEAARIAMERKSKMYEKLKRGKNGGLKEESIIGGLIDWDRKEGESRNHEGDDDERHYGESDGEEQLSGEYDQNQYVEGSNRKKRRKVESLGEDDPLMTYKDEFGRSRTVPKSEVPRDILRAMELESSLPDETNVQYGPSKSFPVYRPPSPVLQAAKSEALKDPVKHFDADFETRDRGAGFYRFSSDEQVRKEEMERMKSERLETERKRLGNELKDEEQDHDQNQDSKDFKVSNDGRMKSSEKIKDKETRKMNVAEKKKMERKLKVDKKRIEIYGEEEVKNWENMKLEAFLNHSLNP